MVAGPAAVPTPRSVLRPLVWGVHVAIPLLGLWLLLAQPQLDLIWEDQPSHFWLILVVAGVNVALGLWMGTGARDRADGRLFLVSLMFLSSAGFFLLHALATPTVLLDEPNTGFVIAAPVGLCVASVFAALSSIHLTPERSRSLMRRSGWLLGGVVALMAGWAAASLLEVPLLTRPLEAEESTLPLVILAVIGVPLYALAAVRYFWLYRRRRAVFLISVITALALLAEAMVAMALAVSWALSWWEWHVLMAIAFLFVAYSARVQHRAEGTTTGLFTAISLEETIRRIREEHGEALEALVEAMRRQEETGLEQPIADVTRRLAARFQLSEGQAQVLERAAEALVSERAQIERLGALVAVGRETRVILDERELLDRALAHASAAFGRDRLRIGIVEGGVLRFAEDAVPSSGPAVEALRSLEPVEADGTLILPLTVKGAAAGVLEVRRGEAAAFPARDRSILQSLASQLSIALENARLYRQLDTLFRSYMSPDVAVALLADPSQAELGGAIVEVTVMFADLRGYTTFSERTEPDQVVALLNSYFGIAVPLILEHGGTVAQFVGDAVMALWNVPTRQPDHALRTCRAALAMQRAIAQAAEGHPDWPRFRVGINSGPALVGNIGSEEFRNFTAIGDTTNLAARLEGRADVGTVLIGERTRELLGDAAHADPVGELTVKGRERAVRAFVLRSIDGSER